MRTMAPKQRTVEDDQPAEPSSENPAIDYIKSPRNCNKHYQCQ